MKTPSHNSGNEKIWLIEAMQKFDKETYFTKGLKGLLEVCGYRSIEHISREIKKHYMKTPSEIINEKRLAYAAEKITSTKAKIIDISLDAGYNSLSYFNRLFKKAYGMSPLQYRKR